MFGAKEFENGNGMDAGSAESRERALNEVGAMVLTGDKVAQFYQLYHGGVLSNTDDSECLRVATELARTDVVESVAMLLLDMSERFQRFGELNEALAEVAVPVEEHGDREGEPVRDVEERHKRALRMLDGKELMSEYATAYRDVAKHMLVTSGEIRERLTNSLLKGEGRDIVSVVEESTAWRFDYPALGRGEGGTG